MQVKLKQDLHYGTKFFPSGSIQDLPESEFIALKNGGIQIEEVKEEVKEKKNVKDV